MKPSGIPLRATLWAVIVFAVVDALFLGDALLPGRMRAPADLLTATGPASGVDPAPAPRNPFLIDWARRFFPRQRLVADAWKNDRVPLWNRFSGTGKPLAADPASEAFSPFTPLLLRFGDDYADARQFAQMFLAQIFTFLVALRLGARPLVAGVAAFVYAFASPMQLWCVDPRGAVAGFVPLIVFTFTALAERGSVWRFTAATTALTAAGMAGSPGLAATAGIVAVFFAASLRPNDRSAVDHGLGVIVKCGFVFLAALFLGAILWLPFWEWILNSATTETRPVLAIESLATIFNLTALGSAVDPSDPYVGKNGPLVDILYIGQFAALLCLPAVLALFSHRGAAARRFFASAIFAGIIVFLPRSWQESGACARVFSILPPHLFSIGVTIGCVGFAAIGAQIVGIFVERRLGPFIARWTILAVMAIVVADGFRSWKSFCPVVGHGLLDPAPTGREILENTADGRGIGVGNVLACETNAAWRVENLIDGPNVTKRLDLFRRAAATPYDFRIDAGPYFADDRLLDVAAARWVLAKGPLDHLPSPGIPVHVTDAAPVIAEMPAPAGETREWLILRKRSAGLLRDGTVKISVTAPSLAEDVSYRPGVEPSAPTEKRIGKFIFVGDPAVLDFMAAHTPEYDGTYVAFKFAFAGVDVTIRVDVDPGGAPIEFLPIVRRAFGGAIVDEKAIGDYRFAKRPQALPRAFFTSRPIYRDDPLEVRDRLRAVDHDIRAGVCLERASEFSDLVVDDRAGIVPIDVDEKSPEELRFSVDLPRPGYVCIMDDPYPGWTAEIDGEIGATVFPANLVGRAVFCPAGRHEIVMRFLPMSFLIGRAVSSATAAALLIALAIGGIRRKRGDAEDVAT